MGELFGKANEIIYNARKLANLHANRNGKKSYYEIDIWIPALKLGFEYQVCFTHVHTSHAHKHAKYTPVRVHECTYKFTHTHNSKYLKYTG